MDAGHRSQHFASAHLIGAREKALDASRWLGEQRRGRSHGGDADLVFPYSHRPRPSGAVGVPKDLSSMAPGGWALDTGM